MRLGFRYAYLTCGPKGSRYSPFDLRKQLLRRVGMCGHVWACSAPAAKIGQWLSSRPVAARGFHSEHGCPGEESVQQDTRACRRAPCATPGHPRNDRTSQAACLRRPARSTGSRRGRSGLARRRFRRRNGAFSGTQRRAREDSGEVGQGGPQAVLACFAETDPHTALSALYKSQLGEVTFQRAAAIEGVLRDVINCEPAVGRGGFHPYQGVRRRLGRRGRDSGTR